MLLMIIVINILGHYRKCRNRNRHYNMYELNNRRLHERETHNHQHHHINNSNTVRGVNSGSCELTWVVSNSWRKFKSGCNRLSRAMVGNAVKCPLACPEKWYIEGDTCKFQSLTAHAADPDSHLIITLTTEGHFRCREKCIEISTMAVLIMMVARPNSSF